MLENVREAHQYVSLGRLPLLRQIGCQQDDVILLETRIFHQRFGQRVGIRGGARQWRDLLVLVLIHAYHQGPIGGHCSAALSRSPARALRVSRVFPLAALSSCPPEAPRHQQ